MMTRLNFVLADPACEYRRTISATPVLLEKMKLISKARDVE